MSSDSAQREHELPPPVVEVDDRGAGAGAGVLPVFLGEPARQRRELRRLDTKPVATMPVHALFAAVERADPRVRELAEQIERALTPNWAPRRA